jgi:hypothetical protein
MYETGTCLKPSWERAERLYLLASQAGHRGGTLRLVAGCAYVAGALAHLASDVDYPMRALAYGAGGEVAMRWQPAQGAMQWRTLRTQQLDGQYGVGDSAALVDGASRRTAKALEDYLRGVGEQALRRYTKPADIDPAWAIEYLFVFSVSMR